MKPERGLIIRQPWIDLILSGEKTWEMRSRPTNIRGKIALIEQGTGLIVGEADIFTCMKTEPNAQFSDYFKNHCISDVNLIAKYPYAWVLENIKRYDKPVPYVHQKGAVIWVKL
jgi:hypothetical protein